MSVVIERLDEGWPSTETTTAKKKSTTSQGCDLRLAAEGRDSVLRAMPGAILARSANRLFCGHSVVEEISAVEGPRLTLDTDEDLM